ncbi:MAG: SsrA-binding protein SmpB [Bacteroidota bacterium]
MADKKKKNTPDFINKRARFEYQFLDSLEAGVMLTGTEVKSVRGGKVNLSDAYCLFERGELFIRNLYITEYENGTYYNHDARRIRKLLLQKKELKKWEKRVTEKGLTVVPYKMYFTDKGFVKIEIVLAQGKKEFDKREAIKEKDNRREMERTRLTVSKYNADK